MYRFSHLFMCPPPPMAITLKSEDTILCVYLYLTGTSERCLEFRQMITDYIRHKKREDVFVFLTVFVVVFYPCQHLCVSA